MTTPRSQTDLDGLVDGTAKLVLNNGKMASAEEASTA
jgi:hypothetical protein